MLYLINEGVTDQDGNSHIRVTPISELEVPLYEDTVCAFDNTADPMIAQDIISKPDDYFIAYEYIPPASDEDIPVVKNKKLMHRIRDSDNNVVGEEEVGPPSPPTPEGDIPISNLKLRWNYVDSLRFEKIILDGSNITRQPIADAEIIQRPEHNDGWTIFRIPRGLYTKRSIYLCFIKYAHDSEAEIIDTINDKCIMCVSLGHRGSVGKGGTPQLEADWSFPVRNIFPPLIRYYDKFVRGLVPGIHGTEGSGWYKSMTIGYLGQEYNNVLFAYTTEDNPTNEYDAYQDVYFRIKGYSIYF